MKLIFVALVALTLSATAFGGAYIPPPKGVQTMCLRTKEVIVMAAEYRQSGVSPQVAEKRISKAYLEPLHHSDVVSLINGVYFKLPRSETDQISDSGGLGLWTACVHVNTPHHGWSPLSPQD